MMIVRIVRRFLFALLFVTSALSSAQDEPLSVKVFHGNEASGGFAVNSVLVTGREDAVLVDAQFTLANAHRLVAEIIETGKRLTTVYVTHSHPDHYFGLPVVTAAFPEARIVALPEVVKVIERENDFKLEFWGKVLGNNGPKTAVRIQPLTGHAIDLEGQRLEILGPMQGDSVDNSAVWIPSIRTLIAGDMLFYHQHVWVGSTKKPEGRRAWLDALDQLEALQAEVVIAGHTQDNSQLTPDAIAFTRRYLQTFERELAATKDAKELIAVMKKEYPDSGLPICIEVSAQVLKDGIPWEGEPWLE
jgi:glyoxylase-like metal-dependent hydrolase (beta-lactamase superfamily II)